MADKKRIGSLGELMCDATEGRLPPEPEFDVMGIWDVPAMARGRATEPKTERGSRRRKSGSDIITSPSPDFDVDCPESPSTVTTAEVKTDEFMKVFLMSD